MEPKMTTRNLTVWFDKKRSINDINLDIESNKITALIGPSGSGKSTFIRCLNRMTELVPTATIKGEVTLDGEDIYSKDIDVHDLRKRVGMVFQKPNPFPKSIHENIAFALRIHGTKRRKDIDEMVEWSLKRAALWDEVEDRLKVSAYNLSGGQQQRLCIARALAIKPEVILLDEPASSLDPIATAKIESLLLDLKKDYTVVIITHNLRQARRIADRTAVLFEGELIEIGDTKKIFTEPESEVTKEYIGGRMG